MSKKEPELFVSFQIYKNGKVTIMYKEKSLTTELNSATTALIIGALAIDAMTRGACRWIEKALDNLFTGGKKKDE